MNILQQHVILLGSTFFCFPPLLVGDEAVVVRVRCNPLTAEKVVYSKTRTYDKVTPLFEDKHTLEEKIAGVWGLYTWIKTRSQYVPPEHWGLDVSNLGVEGPNDAIFVWAMPKTSKYVLILVFDQHISFLCDDVFDFSLTILQKLHETGLACRKNHETVMVLCYIDFATNAVGVIDCTAKKQSWDERYLFVRQLKHSVLFIKCTTEEEFQTHRALLANANYEIKTRGSLPKLLANSETIRR